MRTALVGALLCAAVLPAPSAAAVTARQAALSPGPAVSVSVALTDGAGAAGAGDRLGYRVTVHNLGGADVAGARVEQRMPATTDAVTATGGRVTGEGRGQQKAVWHTDLPAHDVQVFTATAELGERPGAESTGAPGTRRAATTVCVYLPPSDAPAACSGALGDLPGSHPDTAGGGGSLWWVAAVAAGVLFGPGVARAVRRHRTGTPVRAAR